MNAVRGLNVLVLVVILTAFCLQALFALPKLSATTDEPVHLAAGFSYWQTHDFRLNPEHPPLAKLIAALPLMFIHPKFDTNTEAWKAGTEYPFGFTFLYQNDADRLLFWSRTAMVGLAAIGLIVTFLWARDLFGLAAGFFAAGLYAFSPNLLAHGMLITTDVPLAVFTVLTLYLFWKRRDLYAGLALGAAMASKFSGAFLPGLIIVICLAREGRGAFRRLLIMGCASLLVLEAAYLFSESPLLYFRNGTWVNVKVVPNYPFYLFGQLKHGGWWYYFLAAFVVKATVPTLVAMMLALADLRVGLIDRWGEIILISAIAFYLVINSIGANQIGFRYLLPVFPLLFIWTSRIVPRLAASKVGIGAIAVLLLWQAWAAIHAFPNYIPYFNELAGGPAGGPAILDDSNVDWGQGVKLAAEYVRKHSLQNVNLYTFSPFDNPPYYGLPANIPPSEAFERLVKKYPQPGVYIISAHYVARIRTVSPAWSQYKPIDRIGESLLVYAF
jgi:4-amino-4-deoxy-L-arabinose transferase-like glycosyltransferase